MTATDVPDADAEALAACAGGRESALDELYARHSGSCLGLAQSILRDRDYAQDAVQEAYLHLWQHADRFDGRQSSVRSWLLLVTRSKAIDRVRHEERRKAIALSADDDREDTQCQGPEAQALVASLGKEVREALTALSPRNREALVLAYWGGYTQREIAALTDTALGTVKTRTRTAMIQLRGVLDARVLDGI